MPDLPPVSPADPTPPQGTPRAEPPSLTQPPLKLTQQPQIMAALITGLISVLVAVVGIIPALVESGKNSPTPTPPAPLLAAAVPAENTQAVPTHTSMPTVGQPNIIPVGATSTSLPAIGSPRVPSDPQPTIVDNGTQTPNVRLYFDNASFTIRNMSAGRKILADVSFYNDDARWDASQWGLIHQDFKKQNCLRLRDQAAGPRNPPSDCQGNNLLSLMEVGTPVIFWRAEGGFRIERNGVEIGVCSQSPCDLYLSPS